MPILSSPPFPRLSADKVAVSSDRPRSGLAMPHRDISDGQADHACHLLEALRAGQVGGSFWAAPVPPGHEADVWLRPENLRDSRRLVDVHRGRTLLVSLPARRWARSEAVRLARRGITTTIGPIDPWSLFALCREVVVTGDDDIAFLALAAGKKVHCYRDGYLAGWSLTNDGAGIASKGSIGLAMLAHHLLIESAQYRDPFSGAESTAENIIELLAFWRRGIERNRAIAAGAGIAFWKREEIGRMLWSGQPDLPYLSGPSWRGAVRTAKRRGGGVAAWPSRIPGGLPAGAARAGVPLYQVEDGFIRSVGLGSDCIPPLSIVVDRQGIYYDASGPSDLELLIESAEFTPALIRRANAIITHMVERGIGKYQSGLEAVALPEEGKRRILVPGQVEDDLSVKRSGAGVAGNLDLLRRVRQAEPHAFIIFRPHPDVEAGHRVGGVDDAQALVHADVVMRSGSMAGLIDAVDAVHVLTSLAGFEALLRGREVVTHGQPFYAGWGLTKDLAPAIARRRRKISLAELVAATIILYPKYLDPITMLPCPPEILIGRFAGPYRPRLTWVTRLRLLQTKLHGLRMRAR